MSSTYYSITSGITYLLGIDTILNLFGGRVVKRPKALKSLSLETVSFNLMVKEAGICFLSVVKVKF
jgi:hypothetical protein